MTARDAYEARVRHWQAAHAAADARATRVSRLRLGTFLAGVPLTLWGLHTGRAPAWIAGFALIGAFTVLVYVHARVLRTVDEAVAGIAVAREGLARLARSWANLPEVPAPASFDLRTHPYASDLTIVGPGSLATWLGRPATPDGARHLWTLLLAPRSASPIGGRQEATDDLAGRAAFREALAIHGHLTPLDTDDLERFLRWTDGSGGPALPAFLQPIVLVLPLAAWILLGIWFIGAIGRLPPLTGDTFGIWLADCIGSGWWLLPVTLNLWLSRMFKRQITAVFDAAAPGEYALERHAAMLALIETADWKAPLLVSLHDSLAAEGPASIRIAQLARRLGFVYLRDAPLLHGPAQAMTLWDFHLVFALERWRRRTGPRVRRWMDTLGQVDAFAVLARPAADHERWVRPSIGGSGLALAARGLGHPLIPEERCVANDVEIGPPGGVLLITGSNMSGKSTLLRAIGVNIVLAQAGARVCATGMALPSVDLQTSIVVQDSLERGESYFMAALARLKQIVDAADADQAGGQQLLYLLDEILQGTNSAERSIAVRAVTRHLLRARAIGAITTHDLSIAHEEPLDTAADARHFSEQVHADGTMTFDYRLRPGLATSTNALRLMQLMGIQPS